MLQPPRIDTDLDVPADIPVGEATDSSFGEFEACCSQQPQRFYSALTATGDRVLLPVGKAIGRSGAVVDAAPRPQPLHWPGAPLTDQQLVRRMAQEEAMRSGRVARFPAGVAK
jgi:hypothetical protein